MSFYSNFTMAQSTAYMHNHVQAVQDFEKVGVLMETFIKVPDMRIMAEIHRYMQWAIHCPYLFQQEVSSMIEPFLGELQRMHPDHPAVAPVVALADQILTRK